MNDSQPTPPFQILTASEVAQLLRLKEARVYELARMGLIPHIRMGRQVRFALDEIIYWVRDGGRRLA